MKKTKNKEQSDRNKMYRERARKSGRCRTCGRKNERGTLVCTGCQKKNNASVAKLRAERIAAGLCRECGVQPLFTKIRCAACHAKVQR